MLEQLKIENDKVFAFRLDGKITQDEMKQTIEVLKPELETPSHFNVYVEVIEFEGIEPEALKERIAFVLSNYKEILKKVNKVALVTDKKWLQNLAKGAYSLFPGIEQESFSFEEVEKAKQWVAE